MNWLDKVLGGGGPPALEGAPAVRRQKNYAGESGYAYEYFYEGKREWKQASQYCFTVSGDRKTWFETVVEVGHEVWASWGAAHGRELESNERYAVAKLALFEAFDGRETPDALRRPVVVSAAQAEAILEKLGRD
ncbi:MAG: hypothetical protein HY821_21175 [Acidobacteria bacterium]|nr:hypothetical protein [Acidobacteriota bacterium]